MPIPSLTINPGAVQEIRRRLKGAISTICSKDSLSIENTQAIRQLLDVIDAMEMPIKHQLKMRFHLHEKEEDINGEYK